VNTRSNAVVGVPFVVGLISDTHGLLRPEIPGLFAGVDLIIHAGDVGGRSVLEALRAIAPVEAVSGNVDDRHDPLLPRQRSVPVGALSLHVSHGDELGRPTPALLLARYDADILVYGHTHRPITVRDERGRLVVNPGGAGPRRFGLKPSVARLTVVDRTAAVELIVLD
jgi:putative phosphoesterase